jgi:hypothetical protein
MTDYTELGKRLVACKGFRWLPGMLCQRRMHTGEWVSMRLTDDTTVVDYRVVDRAAVPSMNQSATSIMQEGHIVLSGWVLADDLLPDLSDAATKGCVLQLIREAWDDPTFHVWHSRQLDGWTWTARGQHSSVYASPDVFSSEEEAMADAWESVSSLEGADANAEPAPSGPIPMLLEGVRDAENTLDLDDSSREEV